MAGDRWFKLMLSSLPHDFLIRLALNFAATLVLVRWLYYPAQRDRDLSFSLFMFGLTIFLVAYVLKTLDLPASFGFGLFAVFGLLRYRTEGISNKALTYLFIVTALAMLNALGRFTLLDFAVVNGAVLLITGLAEQGRLLGLPAQAREVRQTVQYERVDLIRPERRADLLADLSARTGWMITRVDVTEVDFVKDVATLRVYRQPQEPADSADRGPRPLPTWAAED
ncbi:DUF4956 domain-containing protein [Deinococcus radiotolerans]|uniref:DUF4956 domain-containing protein n=1 Tax=Deinococcus radiotolerans TaxID=1309407 RepID=A0ABQ2FMZ5_9DEIO|nr:DUF4956 domain-containing protein [Deinococcus radiotolerans]GGL08554.1 DUF4956 domain-containing protein [Deinococcus radiotolerans]